MEPLAWIILLAIIGIALLIAELFLPTHGAVGVLGCGALLGAVAVCFRIDAWLGLAVLMVMLIASPFVAAGAVKIWPRTALGRRLILKPIESDIEPPAVAIGQSGVAVSELRPMGICSFGELRLEAISEQGLIPAGASVTVVSIVNNRLTVRQTPA